MKKHVLLIAVLFLFPALVAHGQDVNGTWSLSIVEPGNCTWAGTIDISAPANPGLFTGSASLSPVLNNSCGNRNGSLEGGVFGSGINLTLPTGDPGRFELEGTLSGSFASGSWQSADGSRSGRWNARCTGCFQPVPALPPLGVLLLACLLPLAAILHLHRARRS